MSTTEIKHRSSRRQIGAIGTSARVVLGLLLLAYGVTGAKLRIIDGHVQTGFSVIALALGLIALPAVLLVWQWLRSRRAPNRFEATGPFASSINVLILVALLPTPLYAPAFSFAGEAAAIFYGASLLLAAVRGYGGCEVLAVSNWLLRRDDQVGCFVLSPIDQLERSLAR